MSAEHSMISAKRFEVSPTGWRLAPKDCAIWQPRRVRIGDMDVVVAEAAQRQHDAKPNRPCAHHQNGPASSGDTTRLTNRTA